MKNSGGQKEALEKYSTGKLPLIDENISLDPSGTSHPSEAPQSTPSNDQYSLRQLAEEIRRNASSGSSFIRTLD